jgi:hypothetical protein
MKLVPTRISMLVSLFVLATSFGWSFVRLWPRFFGQQPDVPWLAAATMCVFAATLLVWTLISRRRLQPERGKPRMHSLVAARTAALAMASSRVGALTCGYYLGFALVALTLRPEIHGGQRFAIAVITSIASALVVVIALWLERLCRISPPSDEQGSAEPVA